LTARVGPVVTRDAAVYPRTRVPLSRSLGRRDEYPKYRPHEPPQPHRPAPFSPVWQRLPAAPAGRFGYPPWLTLRPARWSFVGPFFAAGHRVRLMRSKRTD